MPNKLLLQAITHINYQILQTKPLFEAAIKDTNTPLDERWELFVTANDAFKNFSSYLTSFDSLPDDTIMYDGLVHMERYQDMTTVDLVDRLIEAIAETDEEGFVGIYSPEEQEMRRSIDLNKLKEEILATNMGGFTYDW